MNKSSVVFIYVSHHSEPYISRFAEYHRNEFSDLVYVVNSCPTTLKINNDMKFKVIEAQKNIGFAAANNLAINKALKDLNTKLFVLINPDVYLPQNWFSSIINQIDNTTKQTGVFTVPLLGYDFKKDMPTEKIDSLGIYSTWYGRWFDCLQGETVSLLPKYKCIYEIPAACGALMILRREVIDELLATDGFVFNESLFMYKEDIELSIRIRQLGKKTMMIPSCPAYHCRGWANNRANSPYWARELSARNELKIHLKFHWAYLPYSITKYIYVRIFERMVLALSILIER